MNKELPKALTKDSSKASMWREINAMQEEIDSQQATIEALKTGRQVLANDLDAWKDQCRRAEWQLKVIRDLAAGE